MKKILNLVATFAMAALVFAACEPENNTPTPPTPGPGTGTGNGGNENEGGGQTAELKADFTFEADGLTVQFTNASTGAEAYLWNFGDENTATEKDPEHTYDAAGTYTVKLTVQDAAGNAKNVEKEVTVAGAVKAYFSATAKTDRAGKFGKIFTLDATASENAASIVWDFGDGSESSTEFTVDHEFPEFGQTYTVKATVTGQGGDVDTYEATVEVIGYNELLKGGSMDVDDAQFWTVVPGNWATVDYAVAEGTPGFVTEFGHTATVPTGGKGGCLRFGGENQVEDGSYKATVYQAIDVVEGDIIELSALVKWGENAMDNGLFWMNICTEADLDDNGHPTAADANIFVSFMNWWSVGTAVPAYDGPLTGNDVFNNASDYGFSCPDPVQYTATTTGKIYIVFELRTVWGAFFGAGCDYFVDEVSAKIVL